MWNLQFCIVSLLYLLFTLVQFKVYVHVPSNRKSNMAEYILRWSGVICKKICINKVLQNLSSTEQGEYLLPLLKAQFTPEYFQSKENLLNFTTTVGAQSIARLCQNLVNWRRNIWAHRRRRKLRFFLFEKSWAGEWVKILTKVNS